MFTCNAPQAYAGLSDCRPILCVANLAESLTYYVETLGFRVGFAWSKDEQRFLTPEQPGAPDFALVVRDKVQMMLSQQSQGAAGMWLHLDVDSAAQLDALYAEWKQRGARIVEPPEVRPWGMYEMRVEDLDRHLLRVASSP
ncbi:MAG: VOC family protein [Planctomycetales bacterium]|nr:VOC family protein [Planctomycetales bacterium]